MLRRTTNPPPPVVKEVAPPAPAPVRCVKSETPIAKAQRRSLPKRERLILVRTNPDGTRIFRQRPLDFSRHRTVAEIDAGRSITARAVRSHPGGELSKSAAANCFGPLSHGESNAAAQQ